jgi:isoleucyl-tRNA synthetase
MSKNFPEYKGLNLVEVADRILSFWDTHDIFKKSVDQKPEEKPFVFFEGPPSANGLPGIHHVMARTIKDIFCRYKTQKGYRVNRKAGWDTHGLPVELSVEKELGITKEDIGTKISVEEYNTACKKTVMRYTDVWNDLTKKIGYWVDMDDPYITYTPKYMESVWWLLAQIYNKGLMYKGYTIQPYSPKAGTGLSSHELNQPGTYQDVSDTTVTAMFKSQSPLIPEGGTSNSVSKAFKLSDDVEVLPFGKDLGWASFYFLAWTTTPWTLPSNTALTVGKKIDYVLVATYNQYTFEPIYVVLAKALINKQFDKKYQLTEDLSELHSYDNSQKKIPYLIVAECKGEDLIEIKYEQLLPYVKPYHDPENAFRVIAGDFVTTEDGTGIVHTAPTFGADDAMVAKQASPEVPAMLVKDEDDNLVPLVDLKGRFRKEVKDELYGFANEYVKSEYLTDEEIEQEFEKQKEQLKPIISNLSNYLSVDERLALKLKNDNKAFKVEKYVHSYPNCWRTDKPILYYPLDSWFIKVTDKKDRMVELNNTINWKPKSTGEGRFGNWLANANDWNLSRSRYWGIPLPIWRTEDGKEEKIIDSIGTLKTEIDKAVEAGFMTKNPFDGFKIGDVSDENYKDIDIHKNIVDKITLVSNNGQPMQREADLIDVWFDSGSMPYAQWHYPHQNTEEVEDKLKTADFIAEGVDQTRGWFYTLHAIATLVFDDVAYKNVVSNGLVLDKNGQKMSKRLGNAVDPFETLKEYGPDATRWYMISNANPWDNLKFDEKGIEEVKRKFFGTLYNTYSFFALYANIDQFQYAEENIPLKDRPEIDRWILSELHTLIREVDEYYADYEPTKATRAISDFVQENLSNWYVRLSRRRFWKGDYKQDKISAYQTLYTCLLEVSKMIAPVSPFYADQLYKDLTAIKENQQAESVHLADFSSFDEAFVDKALEEKMHTAQIISSLVLSLRKKEMIKVRQPLQRIMVPVLDDKFKADVEAVSDLILSEVNIKEIEFIDDTSDVLVKSVKPNFKVLGPKYGKDMKHAVAVINQLDKAAISTLEKEGKISLEINGEAKEITIEEVEITSEDIEGWLVASHKNITVALDIHIDQKLKNEGIARELVNRIQNLRKDTDLNVTDHINVEIVEEPQIKHAVEENLTYIKRETLTQSITFANRINNGRDIEFDDIKTVISLNKV